MHNSKTSSWKLVKEAGLLILKSSIAFLLLLWLLTRCQPINPTATQKPMAKKQMTPPDAPPTPEETDNIYLTPLPENY